MCVTKYSNYKLIIVWDFLDKDQCVVFLGKSLYSQSVSLLWSMNEYRRIVRKPDEMPLRRGGEGVTLINLDME